jgi:hypothetical protein
MAVLALTNAKILAGQADLSAYSNSVDIAAEADSLDATTFGSTGYKSFVGGLKKVDINVKGLWQATDGGYPDDRLFTDLGVGAVPMTISPTGATVGDIAYFTRVLRPTYMAGGQVGELMSFESHATGDGTALVRGAVTDNQQRTATGTSTILSLTAPTASQRVTAALHITAWSGTGTVTATLQGDNAIGFPSPATVATGTALSAAGSQFLAGAYGVNADSYFRLSYVVTGTPTFTIVAAIGVGS